MILNLNECGHIKNAPLINVLLSEGVNVVEDGRGCAVRAVREFDHMAETRRPFNGENHFYGQDTSLIHLKTNDKLVVGIKLLELLLINRILYEPQCLNVCSAECWMTSD